MDLGEWNPLHPEEVRACLAGVDARWWIAGGWAIDLFLGRQTREHADLDVGLLRGDEPKLFERFAGWEFFSARSGKLHRLEPGTSLDESDHSVWCRPGPALPWSVELMPNEWRGDCWVYRRDPGIERPLDEIVRHDPRGIPYLVPEVQLLFKSKRLRAKDTRDLEAVLPRLGAAPRAWLEHALQRVDPTHPWLSRL